MKIILGAIILTLITLVLLFLFKEVLLDSIIDFIQKVKQTDHYEGETEARERIMIISYILLPIIFIIYLSILLLRKNKKFPNR